MPGAYSTFSNRHFVNIFEFRIREEALPKALEIQSRCGDGQRALQPSGWSGCEREEVFSGGSEALEIGTSLA